MHNLGRVPTSAAWRAHFNAVLLVGESSKCGDTFNAVLLVGESNISVVITAASSSAHNATKAGKVKGKDSQFSSCVKMEVAVPDFLFLIASTASVEAKQH